MMLPLRIVVGRKCGLYSDDYNFGIRDWLKLIYLAHTWPNIAHAMSVINQFMYLLKGFHLQVAYRILHYLKGSLRKGILFKRERRLTLEGYTSVDYAVLLLSTTKYCTFLGVNLVTWRSKKQVLWQDHRLNQNLGPLQRVM